MRKAYLASLVPVIVNAILSEHQLVVDIVAFVSKGDFPRSRLGEKQRGKILASWVTRKLRTIAQFSIRDADGADSQITEVAEPRSELGSVVGVGSSLRNVETVTTPPTGTMQHTRDYTSLPTGISEMPANYESSIVESPPLPTEEDRDDTPTDLRKEKYSIDDSDDDTQYNNNGYAQHDAYPPNSKQLPNDLISSSSTSPDQYPDYEAYNATSDPDITPSNPSHTFNLHPIDQAPPPARYESKPVLSLSPHLDNGYNNNNNRGGGFMSGESEGSGDLWSLPSQQRHSSQNLYGSADKNPPGTGPLRVANSTSSRSSAEDAPWPQEAIMHMNLERDGTRTQNQRHYAERGGGLYDSNSSHPFQYQQQPQPQPQQQQQKQQQQPGTYDGSGYGEDLPRGYGSA